MPAGLDGNPRPLQSDARSRVLRSIAQSVAARCAKPRIAVAIDGASSTGKSTLADELAAVLAGDGNSVVRASVDSFHRPRQERYERGVDSPEGYYYDSHDLNALRTELLTPFVEGKTFVRRAVFDEPSDTPLRTPREAVPVSAVLVFDGLFLHRPELLGYWDITVFLYADERREQQWQHYLTTELPADDEARRADIERRIARARHDRYVIGQRIYETAADPVQTATFLIDNDDFANPRLLRAPD